MPRLQDLKIVCINSKNDECKSQRINMEYILHQLGCTNISHYLEKDRKEEAIVAILKSHMDEPVFILDEDMDYIGIDTYGEETGADAIHFGSSISECATLFITRPYKQAVINLLEKNIQMNPQFLILINKKPSFTKKPFTSGSSSP